MQRQVLATGQLVKLIANASSADTYFAGVGSTNNLEIALVGRTGTGEPLLYQYSASGPAQERRPPLDGGITLRGISRRDDELWLVGDRGAVVRVLADGGFVVVDTPTTAVLRGVYASPDGGVFVVGADGTLLYRRD